MFKRFNLFSFYFVIAALLSIGPAFAYDGGSLCEALLSQGIRDTQTLNISKSQYGEISSEVCSSKYDNYANAQSNSANGGLDIPGELGISGSDTNASSDYLTKWAEFCGSDYEKSMSDGQLSAYVSNINAGILHSFDHCVDLNAQTFIRYVQPDASGKIFTIVLNDRADGVTNFTITQLTLIDTTSGSPLDLTRDCNLPHRLPYSTGDFNHVNILCRKPAADDVVVSGATTAGIIDTVTIPGVPTAPPSVAQQVTLLEGEVSGLTAQLGAFKSVQIAVNQAMENQLANMKVDLIDHVTATPVHNDTFIATFPFPVIHTWIEPVDNYTNIDGIVPSITGTNTVTVTATLHGTGPNGAGLIRYTVVATSF